MERTRRAGLRLLIGLALLAGLPVPTRAQVLPSDEARNRERGRVGGRDSVLGAAPGAGENALGNSPGETGSIQLGRPGRPGTTIPADITRPDGGQNRPSPGIVTPSPLPDQPLPTFGALALPAEDLAGSEGDPGGLTLDIAIERLVANNLDLRTQFFELPQAQADVLTAGLRANPLLYLDSNAIPYGNYSNARPGGQTQYDFTITHPFDINGKRRARVVAACKAKQVIEAQYQDAVRLQIDNLYTAFIDCLTARESLRFSHASLEGFEQVLTSTKDLAARGQKTQFEVAAIQLQRDTALIGLRDAEAAQRRARQNLAALLNEPPDRRSRLEVKGSIRLRGVTPPPDDQLYSIAIDSRPDLAAYRLGLSRAQADVQLARANRFGDVYVQYSPYVFQNNAPFGTKSAHSWSAAVTIPFPVYNRNQGNIERARLNVNQTQTGMASLERKIFAEVVQADEEYDLSLESLEQIERDVLPTASKNLVNARRLYVGGESNVLDYLNAQRDYNEIVRQYFTIVVRHRRSMLDLNTALGRRVVP